MVAAAVLLGRRRPPPRAQPRKRPVANLRGLVRGAELGLGLAQRLDGRFRRVRGELLEVLTPDGPIAYGYDVLGRRLTRNGPDGTTRNLYGDPNNMNSVTHAVRPDGTLFALFCWAFVYVDCGGHGLSLIHI